ncbi:Putative Co/Zn/Cd efflux system membrane fusion protein [Minicystis rosea]|nr:Putative Co/Zn/Cd efflux system membrane fusion protein [Minicystis rosea]
MERNMDKPSAPVPIAAPPRPPKIFRGLVMIGVALATLGVVGTLPRLRRNVALADTQAAATAARRVLVGKATSGPTRVEITLPGTIAPFRGTMLYAKTTGFVRTFSADIGDRVKAGQVLAEIQAPETDEELRLARARVREAEANLAIADENARRNDKLADAGLVSQQEASERRARANSAEAALGTSRAEVGRIGALMGYQKIVAPFDGVIVRRGTELGALVTPGGTSLLFELAHIDTLRVFIDVPQALAAGVHIGGDAAVFLPSAPKDIVKGKIARTAGALDASTHTLRAEIHIAGGGPLLSGAFVSVRLGLENPAPPVIIPASALAVRKEGTHVLRVGPNRAVGMAKIEIGRDLGKEIEALSGIAVGDTVVLNPPDDLLAGEIVEPVERASAP